MKNRTDLADHFAWLCKINGLPIPSREFVFAVGRRFRFDAAFVAEKVAVEIHGGVWTFGRHTRGAGFTADCEKARLAVRFGWRLLPFTGSELTDHPLRVIDEVRQILEMKGSHVPL